jgi:hypothetical protein
MPSRKHARAATTLAAQRHHVRHPLVIDSAQAVDRKSGRVFYRYKVVSGDNANGPPLTVLLDEDGNALEMTSERLQAFDRAVLHTAGITPVAHATVQPNTNVLTLDPGQVFEETLTVTIPKSAGTPVADVYFLADTTGSMTAILGAVQAGANNVLTALNGLGADIAFGVGNYKDFASGDPYGFQHQVSPTHSLPTATAGINAWSASGGGDLPEAGLFALDSLAVAPGPGIGWRSGAKRIIVWFGDAPGHDPVCAGVSGAPTVTEASATAKLVAQGITVLAISTATPGLDDNPTLGESGYDAICGPPGGTPGQATRITAATGGTLATGINATTIVNTIIAMVTAAVGQIQNVKLVPSVSIASFVTAITPAGGYGPLSGNQDHTVTFDVKFVGGACQSKDQIVNGTLDVVADGSVIATKTVQITVPACRFVYVAKLLCGVQTECDCTCTPLAPGTYATAIAIHNYSLKPVDIVKRFVPVVMAGAVTGREPNSSSTRAEDRITLPAQSATLDDCCRIAQLVFGNPPQAPGPLTIGLLEITASAEVAVSALYTTGGVGAEGGLALDVVSVEVQR